MDFSTWSENMCLDFTSRRKLIVEIAPKYQKARRRKKSALLDEYTPITGLTRNYLAFLLRNHGKKRVLYASDGRAVVTADARLRIPRKRPRTYDKHVERELVFLWKLSGCLCSRRLVQFIRTVLPSLVKNRKYTVAADVKAKLMTISHATIDRLMQKEKARYRIKGRSSTKPGTLLKHQIPIRTYDEWNEQKPGFVEIDLVSHDNGDPKGEHCYSLNVVDISTGWQELRPIKNKAQVWTLDALKDVKAILPFRLRGVDSDNGSEFINAHMVQFCKDEEITFTRSRPYRKNDNCFVEQKNYTSVRTFVGYGRYEEDALPVLRELEELAGLKINFFQPSCKLVSKTRNGAKVSKKYDMPRTPLQRLLDSDTISDSKKMELKQKYQSLDLIAMTRRIALLQKRLEKLAKKT